MPQDRLSTQQEKARKTEPVAPAPPAIERKQDSGSEFNAKGSVQEPTKATRSKNTSLQAPSEASRAAPRTSAPETPPSALEDQKEQLDAAATNSQRTSEESTTPPGGAAGAAAPALQSLRRERTGTAEPSADRASSSQDQPTPDYELVVRLRSQERREQSPADSTNVLSKSAEKDKPLQDRTGSIAGATVASPSTPPLTGTVWYRVPQNRYDEFKRNLAAQGTIEFETAASTKEKEAARKPEDLLSIKVTIMPPR
jgi:hypothetical protein